MPAAKNVTEINDDIGSTSVADKIMAGVHMVVFADHHLFEMYFLVYLT